MLRRMPDRHRVLATVLFTDIVGSTERAAEVGDAAWRQLMARHHSAVRREVRRFGGREQDSAGDGFFLAFDRPMAALRCAAAILAAVASLGMEERAAVHTGEVERMQGKLGGIAVHTAARMLAVASPGEVVVTATTRELVAGSGLRFTDRGPHTLKGLPEPIHLFALEAPESLVAAPTRPVGAAAPDLGRLGPWAARVAAVAVLAVAIAAVATRGIGNPGGGNGPVLGAATGSPPSRFPSFTSLPSTTAGISDTAANLPNWGPITPGRYLLASLRGGVIVTISDSYWSIGRDTGYWYASSYPDTRLWLVQEPPPSTAGCGSPKPSPGGSGGLYEDWIAWLTHDPRLLTSAPIRRLFGTTGGTEVDTRIVPARACPPLTGIDPHGGAKWTVIAESKLVRIYIIDSPEPFLVLLGAPTQQQLDAGAKEVDAMLTTLEFEP
jgi:class 3 adenylate cyclase